MTHIGFPTAVFLLVLLGGASSAHALTSEQGTAVTGDHANVADPDDQVPGYLKSPEDQRSLSPSNQFDSNDGSSSPIFRPNISGGAYPTPQSHPIFSDQFNSGR